MEKVEGISIMPLITHIGHENKPTSNNELLKILFVILLPIVDLATSNNRRTINIRQGGKVNSIDQIRSVCFSERSERKVSPLE